MRSPDHANFAEAGIIEEMLCGCDFPTVQTIFSAHTTDPADQSCSADDIKQTILDSHGIVDLSRLTPKMYLPLRQGRQALRDEVYGILRQDRNGVPIGEIFQRGDLKWGNVPWVMTTVVTKIKTDGTVKSRLCLRGDRTPSTDQPSASAPTVSRDFLKIFCGLYVNLKHFSWVQVDISKAFTESDLFREKDRIAARLPEFVGVNGRSFQGRIDLPNKADVFEKRVASDDPSFLQTKPIVCSNSQSFPNEYAIGLNRPLYGSHDAPLRWNLAITKALIRHKFLPLHVDKCFRMPYSVCRCSSPTCCTREDNRSFSAGACG